MKHRIASYIGAAFTLALTTPSAFAAVALTNGNFETGAGVNVSDIPGWFDNENGAYYTSTWQTNAGVVSPNGSSVVVLSNYEGALNPATASTNVLDGDYLYQSIGTKEAGDTGLQVNFDFGQANDSVAGRTYGITVAIYAFDGIGTFVAGNEASLYTASQTVGSGVTLLDNKTFQFGPTTVADQPLVATQTSLNISAAGSQALYLSFNNYRPAATESWSIVDNVSIAAIPEPSAALLGGLGLLALLRRRR